MDNRKSLCGLVVSLSMAILSNHAFALADKTHPRDYIPAPPGTDVGVFYLDHRSGNSLNSNGSEVANNADLSVNVATARYIHYTEVGGYTIDPQIVVPYADLDLGIAQQSSTGVGDVVIGAPFWLINDNEKKEWFSIAPFLWVPVGAYDENKAVNFGTNTYRPLLGFGYVKGLTDKLYIDFVGDIEWSTDNDSPNGGSRLEKDPVYRLNSMLSYNLSDTGYIWGKYVIQKGGEQKLDGVSLNNKQDDRTLVVGYSNWISKSTQFQAEYSTDLQVENGVEVDGFSLRMVTVF